MARRTDGGSRGREANVNMHKNNGKDGRLTGAGASRRVRIRVRPQTDKRSDSVPKHPLRGAGTNRVEFGTSHTRAAAPDRAARAVEPRKLQDKASLSRGGASQPAGATSVMKTLLRVLIICVGMLRLCSNLSVAPRGMGQQGLLVHLDVQ